MTARSNPSLRGAPGERAPTREHLEAELAALRQRLADAEATLQAIGNDEVDALVVVARDRGTEEVRTLAGADSSYRHFVESMRDGAVMVAEYGTILNANPRFAELAACGDVVGRTLGELLETEEDLPTLLQNLGAQTKVVTAAMCRPDDTRVAVELSVTALPLVGPRRIGIIVNSQVPESRRVSVASSPAGARPVSPALAVLLDHVSLGVIAVDARTRTITYSNRRAEEILGRELSGYRDPISHFELAAWRPDGTIVEPNQILIARVLGGEEPVREDLALVRGDGTIVQTRAAAAPVHDDDGRLASIVLTFDDATEEWLARAEREANERFRELFIGILGHDLRDPLGVLTVGSSMLLRRGALEPEDKRIVERLASSANRMTRMVAQILDFTRARMGDGIPLNRQPTSLHDVVRTVLADSLLSQETSRVALSLAGDGIGDWDADRLAQVVSNLVSNALWHGAPETQVCVSVRDEPRSVRLEVHNEGRPIPEDLLPVIFDPFRRAAVAHNRSGLGLGLYIAQQIVRAHDGTLTVESTAERGTTFTVVLPRANG